MLSLVGLWGIIARSPPLGSNVCLEALLDLDGLKSLGMSEEGD